MTSAAMQGGRAIHSEQEYPPAVHCFAPDSACLGECPWRTPKCVPPMTQGEPLP